jgi:imidazolonepropionase-like amidohydrolase
MNFAKPERLLAHARRLSLMILLSTGSSFAHDMVPGAKQDRPIALRRGTIHTVSGETIERGTLLFDEGKIVAVGTKVSLPKDCQVVDIKGKHLYPGLISSNSTLGLVEIDAVRASRDLAEPGPFNPNVRADVAFNPDSELIPVTRANGVLVAHVAPLTGQGGLIAGSSAVLALDGWTKEDMTIKAPLGVVIQWPNPPSEPTFHPDSPVVYNAAKQEEGYQEQVDKLRGAFEDARAFHEAQAGGVKTLNVDLRWEALIPVLKRERPVFIIAGRIRQIRDAIHWATEEGLNLILVGGADTWRAVDLLKKHQVPVIVSQVNALPARRWESYDTVYRNPLKLHEAGIEFAIAYGGGEDLSTNERNLPYEAGKAVAHGLPQAEALKAITLYPARILGVDDRLGSLEVGKDATLIVTTGDPLDIRTQVERAFIEGRSVDLSSRHTQLYEKYQKKYERQ